MPSMPLLPKPPGTMIPAALATTSQAFWYSSLTGNSRCSASTYKQNGVSCAREARTSISATDAEREIHSLYTYILHLELLPAGQSGMLESFDDRAVSIRLTHVLADEDDFKLLRNRSVSAILKIHAVMS